jgi:alkylation response protein AidB-like acyl-CoA dehydrogenase
MVDFAFTEAHQEFARCAHVRVGRVVPKYAHWDRTGEFPAQQWRKMGQLGITGICISGAYGDRRLIASQRGSPLRRSPVAILTAGTP